MTEQLTVVVPVVTDLEHTTHCLIQLERERQTFALRALVVSRLSPAVAEALRGRFQWAEIVEMPAATSIPVLRAAGAARSRSQVTAIIEDHVLVPEGWAARMTELVLASNGPVAGPVDDASVGLAARASFLCEYSGGLPPVVSGPTDAAPGNNTGYPTVLLMKHIRLLEDGAWEDEVHEAMRRDGAQAVLSADLTAAHALQVGAISYLGLRYHYSRAWAGRRHRGASFAIRGLRAAGCLVLPAVLLARIVGRGLSRPGYRGVVVMSLPLQLLFVVAWAAGELVGVLAGPGSSLTKVR